MKTLKAWVETLKTDEDAQFACGVGIVAFVIGLVMGLIL